MDALGDLAESLRFLEAPRNHFAADLERMREQERQWREKDPGYPDALPPEYLHVQMVLRLGLIGGEARVRGVYRGAARADCHLRVRSGRYS